MKRIQLRIKFYEIKHLILLNPEYDGYQRGLASMVYKFFDKKSKGSDVANNEIKQNLQLAEELHNPIIRKFKKKKSLLWIQR